MGHTITMGTRTLGIALLLISVALLFRGAGARANELGGAAPVEGIAGGSTFSLLSYNVHGLFPLAAKDDPRDRMPTIGWLANPYQVILFQEDFEYHHVLAEQLEDSIGYRGNGMGWDPRRLLAKAFLAPVAIFLPHFSPPYGDGVTTWAEKEFAPSDVAREPYSVCHGWFGANGDCWARKGFLRVRIHPPGGGEIDVYNTHLEAGPTERSMEVRRIQLDALAEGIERLSPDRAVIVSGDLNLAFIRPTDRDMILGFRERLGLKDSGAGPQIPIWRERGHVLYRSGTTTRLTTEDSGEALEFVSRERTLSDHPAFRVTFRVEQVAP